MGDSSRRLALVTAVSGASLAGCAGPDDDGGDCVVEGVVRMGREDRPTASVTCEVPGESWIVALRPGAGIGDFGELPEVFRPILVQSAAQGHTWCVLRPGEPGTTTVGRTTCRSLPVLVDATAAVRARRFVVDLELLPSGEATLRRLAAAGG